MNCRKKTQLIESLTENTDSFHYSDTVSHKICQKTLLYNISSDLGIIKTFIRHSGRTQKYAQLQFFLSLQDYEY